MAGTNGKLQAPFCSLEKEAAMASPTSTPTDPLYPWPMAFTSSPRCCPWCGPSPQLPSLLLQIAAMRVASPTRLAIPGAGPTRLAATCWSACAWATGRASGPASPWVGGSSLLLPQLGQGVWPLPPCLP